MAGCASQYSCLAEFEAHLLSYNEENKTKFVVLKSDKQFGKADFSLTGKAVHWQLKTVPYDGTPFVVLGTKTFICHQGRDKHAAEKRKREEKVAKHHKEEQVLAETRQLMRTTKKTGCPAAIYAVHICRFPDYKINEDTPYQRQEKSAAVRKALGGDPSHVGTEQMFAAYFPHVTEHKNHTIIGQDLVALSSSSSTVLTSPRTKARKRQKCGSLLKELADKVCHLQDKSYMDRLIKKLEDLLEDIGQHTRHDGPVAHSYTPPVKRKFSEAAEPLRPLNKQR